MATPFPGMDSEELRRLLEQFQPNASDKRQALGMGLLSGGLALAGARKGQEFNALAQAGLLGVGNYRGALQDASQSKREAMSAGAIQMQLQDMMQRRAYETQQRGQFDQARAAATIPGQPGMPEYGPPTPQGAMQPAVAPTSPRLDDAKYAAAVKLFNPQAGAQYEASMAKESPFDKPKPEHWTPESLAKFAQSRNYADLSPVVAAKEPVSPVGKLNAADFTPESVAAFVNGGGKDYSVLRPIDKTPRTTVNVDARQPPPKGYRWAKGGNELEVIPGGPEDTSKKDSARAENSVNRADIILTKVDEALKDVGYTTTGLVGAMAGRIPGTSALDLKKTTDTIKANIGFQELQAMREASPTGGALGQVAVQELNMLQAVISSLDTEQSPQKMRSNLVQVQKHMNNWRSIMKRAQAQAAPASNGWSITPVGN